MRRGAAFSLPELLVALAICAVLLAIAIPVYNRVHGRSLSSACLANLRTLGAALQNYLGDHDNTMPTLTLGQGTREGAGGFIEVAGQYLATPGAFICPADPRHGQPEGTSYWWNVALNGQRLASLNVFGILDKFGRIPVLCDKEGWHSHTPNKVNFLYADGHVTEGLRLDTSE